MIQTMNKMKARIDLHYTIKYWLQVLLGWLAIRRALSCAGGHVYAHSPVPISNYYPTLSSHRHSDMSSPARSRLGPHQSIHLSLVVLGRFPLANHPPYYSDQAAYGLFATTRASASAAASSSFLLIFSGHRTFFRSFRAGGGVILPLVLLPLLRPVLALLVQLSPLRSAARHATAGPTCSFCYGALTPGRAPLPRTAPCMRCRKWDSGASCCCGGCRSARAAQTCWALDVETAAGWVLWL